MNKIDYVIVYLCLFRMSGEMSGGGIPVHVQGMPGIPAGMTSLQV